MTRRRAIRVGGISTVLGFIVLVFALPAAVRQQPPRTPPSAAAPAVQEAKPRTVSYRSSSSHQPSFVF